MAETLAGLILKIRASSREMVRELGFMNRTIAGTNLTESAATQLSKSVLPVGSQPNISPSDCDSRNKR